MNLDGNENEMIVANNYVTAEQIADHRWSPITELPAIFFAKVGAAVMLNRKRLCRFPFLLDNNTMAYSLSPTKWDADFAKALFGTVDLTSLVQVGALPSYNAGDVESMGIYLPSLFEQEQIGAFFKLLDNLITLHQRQSFSHSTPDISLSVQLIHPFYTSSWEQRKLGDIASDMVAGGDIDKDLILAEGQYPVIANALTGDGIVGYYDKEYRVNAPAVTVTGRGDVGHAKARLVNFTPVVRLLSVKSEHDVFFLENAINTLKIVIESTGVPQLTVPQLAKYEVAFPRQLDEEEHIGAFFKQLDHLITLHQRKGKAAVSGCSNDANNSKGVCCKARDFGYKCHKKDESK